MDTDKKGKGMRGRLPRFKWVKADENAIPPIKFRETDVGFDLSIIKEYKRFPGTSSILYDTGIKIQPEEGYYIEIVPRSSLPKSGYALSNSIGVIDPGYTGSVLVWLHKINPDAKPIEFPFRCVQMIIRRFIVGEMIQVENFDETDRGEGGFGSTGV